MADAQDVLRRRRVLVAELRRADENALPIPRKSPIRVQNIDRSLALAVTDLSRDVERGGGCNLRFQALGVQVVRTGLQASQRPGQFEGVVQGRLNTREFQQARVDVAGMEVRDLAGGITSERTAGRIVRKIGRVITSVEIIRERQ